MSAKHDRNQISIWNTDLNQFPGVVIRFNEGSKTLNPSLRITSSHRPVERFNPVIRQLLLPVDGDFDFHRLVGLQRRDVNANFVHIYRGDEVLSVGVDIVALDEIFRHDMTVE